MQDATTPDRAGMRARLGARLEDLHRRVMHVRAMISPRAYVANPWFRLGAAAVVGYRLGCPDQTTRDVGRPETVLRALLRTVFVNVATSAIRDAVSSDDERLVPPTTGVFARAPAARA